MGKGAKGKSSATSGTRKKHAKKHALPEDAVPIVKKVKGKKKDKEPRKKVYIPPIKPAPVQPDPLETTGLAHTLPAELLVVLRSFSKKAQVTKIRALEELNAGWVEKALQEGEDGSLAYTLVEMLPVWMHHLPALFIHPSRRVRGLAASIQLSFLRIPAVRDDMLFFIKETASPSQVESLLGSWCMAAHDVDKGVAATALKAWYEAAIVAPFFDFISQTILDPEGSYAQLNPVQVPVIVPRKGSAKQARKPEEEVVRTKADELEESDQDKKARLRISAMGAFSWLAAQEKALPEEAIALISNPAFLSCLYPSQSAPWIADMEAFGHAQPAVRRAMWSLLHVLLRGKKEYISSSVPALSRAMLRSAWVETDSTVQAALWHPLLMFLKDFPKAWELAATEDDDDSDEEDEPVADEKNPAYDEFLQFLRLGCNGSPIQGYSIIIITISTIPSSILFSCLDDFFAAFWGGLDSRALSSLNRTNAAAAFLSSLLECTGFLARRLEGDSSQSFKALEIVTTQVEKVWDELAEGRLKVDESVLAQQFTKTLVYLKKVKPELHAAAWERLRACTNRVSKQNPTMVTSFLQGLAAEAGKEEGDQGESHGELLSDLSNDALAAFENDSDDQKARQLLPDIIHRFQGSLFKDEAFVERLDELLASRSDSMITTSPSTILSILSFWKDESKGNALWQSVLAQLASPNARSGVEEALLARVMEALGKGRLPSYLKPANEVFDGVVSGLLDDPGKVSVLKGILQYHSYFMTDPGFVALFKDLATSLTSQLTMLIEGTPTTPFKPLLELVFSTYTASPKTVAQVAGLNTLMARIFLLGRLLPLCQATGSDDDNYSLARDFWYFWTSEESTTKEAKSAVLDVVKNQLRDFVVRTDNPQVSPEAVLAFLQQRAPEYKDDSILDFLPSESELDSMLDKLTPSAIDPSMAVIDDLLPPPSSAPSSRSYADPSPSSNDVRGFSSYSRGVSALLHALAANRTLAKKSVWALRHFLALSVYIKDFQSVPGGWSPVFDERAFASSTLGGLTEQIEQMTTYLLLSSGDSSSSNSWTRQAVESLVATAAQPPSPPSAFSNQSHADPLSHFVSCTVNAARKEDAPRDTRVLQVVLEHILGDADLGEVDLWITLARKLERSAPETSLTIIHALTRLNLELPKLDRYRNEAAASLLGIPAHRVGSDGLHALRRLAASAPDADSELVFLPQMRAVNAVKACQKWVEEAEDKDEDEDEDGEGGVGEDVENAMLPVFAAVAPILQNDHGKHWDFIFDVVEIVLENSSVSDDKTLVGLARALRMVIVIEDLCKTNKGLRAVWEPRRTNVLTLIRDLAAARLENTAVSLPRSICRELLLSIVQTLPPSLVDHETLGKMCHLLTDPSTDVQKMAYQMLKVAAERRTEYLVIEVGVGNIGGEPTEEAALESKLDGVASASGTATPVGTGSETPGSYKARKKRQKELEALQKKTPIGLLPDELVAIIAQDVSPPQHGDEDDAVLEQQHRAFGWMLGWMVVFDLFAHASFKVKAMYIEQLRNRDLVASSLLPYIVGVLRLDAGLNKAFKIHLWGVDEFFVQFYEPSGAVSIPVLAAHLYYRALLCVPSLVHTWVLDCKDRQLSNAIVSITAQCFSPLIIQAELGHLRSAEGMAELTGDGMTVKVIGGGAGSGGAMTSGGNEVLAAYAVDDHQLEIRLKIPSDWPLHRIEVKDEKRVGVDENRWRAWVLAVQQTIWTHNGRIVDGLSLFKKNVTLHFEGQVECAICYSIISVMDGSLPKKPCKTCKNRFHAGCLYKWFNTSHSSSCPLCRTNII